MPTRTFSAAVLLLLLASLHPSAAQYPNVRVSDPSSTDPEEVTIAINPVDPLSLAAGANIDYHYSSFDGGSTWQEGRLWSTLGVYGDPCVVFDADGSLYHGHLSWPQEGSWIDRIVVQKSLDGGLTWSDGVGVGLNPPKKQDKEWLAVDLTGSPWHNQVYMAWTEFDHYGSSEPEDSSRILFSRSAPGGETWSAPVRVSDQAGTCSDGNDTVEGAVPAVGPQGEIYVSWAGHEMLWFDKSLDGGLTFGQDIALAAQPGGWDFNVSGIFRCNGFPVTACDTSRSLYRGTIYVLWSDQRNGTDDTDVFLLKSTDGGTSWGDPVRVNQDVGPAQQFFPWLTVDPVTGRLWVVFYDRRATAGDETEVWVAWSSNAGESFTEFRVSESSFTPVHQVFFGDYTNIAARAGRVYPIWMRMDGTALSIWMAIIDESLAVDPNAAAPASIELLGSLPNPWRAGQPISFDLPWVADVDLSVHSAEGRLVARLVDRTLAAGRHSTTWAAEGVTSNVYFIDLRAGQFRERRSILILK
jgi:hypothetical protein